MVRGRAPSVAYFARTELEGGTEQVRVDFVNWNCSSSQIRLSGRRLCAFSPRVDKVVTMTVHVA